MRVKQLTLHRRHGIRRVEELTRPRISKLENFELPIPAIYHFVPHDSSTIGPNQEDPVIATYDNRVFIEHITDLKSRVGNPKRTAVNPKLIENDFRRNSRGFKPLRRDDALTLNERNGLVINYGVLNPIYRYFVSFQKSYYEWRNIRETLWKTVTEADARFKWNQYIPIELPTNFPTRENFIRLSTSRTETSLKPFTENEAMDLFDLWMWAGVNREESAMANIAPEAYDHINLIFKIKGYFFILNLGMLDSWRESEEKKGGLPPETLQLRLTSLYHGLRDIQEGLTTPDVYKEDTDNDVSAPGDVEGILPYAPILQVPEPISPPEWTTPLHLDVEEGAAGKAMVESDDDDIEVRYSKRIEDETNHLAEVGLLTPKMQERTLKEARRFTELKDPFGSGKSISEAMKTKPEDYKLPENKPLPDRKTIHDKSMLSSSLRSFHRNYVTSLMDKHVMQSVMSVQKLGLMVKDYKVETVRDAMNHYQIHTVTVKPIKGRQSTLRFRTPVINKSGRFISNGKENRMRLQRTDKPIRKVKPTQVALTSYYNKTFVQRSDKKANDFGGWLTSKITALGLDEDDARVTNMRLSNVFDQLQKTPRVYAMISRKFLQFESHDITFYWQFSERGKYFAERGIDITQHEDEDKVVVGSKGNTPVLMDWNNTLYINNEAIGDVPSVCGIDLVKTPLEVVDVTIAGKSIPIGLVLAYHLGLNELINMLGCEVTRFRRGERFTLQPDEFALTFSDEVLVFTRLDTKTMFVLGGLQRYHKSLKEFSVWDFNNKDVYFNILTGVGLGVRHLREMDTIFSAWVDPVTYDLLKQMREPTTFKGLLMRAVELLEDDYSLGEVDGSEMRYRGYERISGMVYGELMRSAKIFNARPGTDHQVELKPHAVWQRTVSDPSVSLCEDANPIQNLREQEVMTYRGDGGRSNQSMVQRTRIFSQSDLGVVSESTQDSGDVGVVAYLSPNANIVDMFGTTREWNKEKDGPSCILSSSSLNAPGVQHDDGKRINLVPVQAQQGIFADGYQASPLRTGYEQVVASRTNDKFASIAEDQGVIEDVNKRAIRVKYKDGTIESHPLGRMYGSSGGVTYPHDLVTVLKKGDKVKYGDVLTFNRKFFIPDPFNKNQVVYKQGVICRTAFIDDIDTLEDGSAISEEMAKALTTQTSEVRTIQVRFDQYVHDLTKIGTHVDLETILCTIEDPETAENPLFDEVAADTLSRLTAQTPRAKTTGVISNIEVYYHGDYEDLSPNLKAIVDVSDAERKRKAKALGVPAYTGQVDTSFRVTGNALDPDTIAIQFTIDHNVPAGTGDKGVFSNQMKTVFSRVMKGVNETLDGEPLGAKFGNTSVEARIVLSPKLWGTTNTLLRVGSKHIVDVYRGRKNGIRKQRKS